MLLTQLNFFPIQGINIPQHLDTYTFGLIFNRYIKFNSLVILKGIRKPEGVRDSPGIKGCDFNT